MSRWKRFIARPLVLKYFDFSHCNGNTTGWNGQKMKKNFSYRHEFLGIIKLADWLLESTFPPDPTPYENVVQQQRMSLHLCLWKLVGWNYQKLPRAMMVLCTSNSIFRLNYRLDKLNHIFHSFFLLQRLSVKFLFCMSLLRLQQLTHRIWQKTIVFPYFFLTLSPKLPFCSRNLIGRISLTVSKTIFSRLSIYHFLHLSIGFLVDMSQSAISKWQIFRNFKTSGFAPSSRNFVRHN